jgi:hypothetical protein
VDDVRDEIELYKFTLEGLEEGNAEYKKTKALERGALANLGDLENTLESMERQFHTWERQRDRYELEQKNKQDNTSLKDASEKAQKYYEEQEAKIENATL